MPVSRMTLPLLRREPPEMVVPLAVSTWESMVPELVKVPVSDRSDPGSRSMVPRFGVLPGVIPALAMVWRVSVWPA